MKQLSSSELNNMSKEEMAAMILQMQQLHEQLSQQQKQMEQHCHPFSGGSYYECQVYQCHSPVQYCSGL